MKFILLCVTLDLSDNMTEMRQIGLSWKTQLGPEAIQEATSLSLSLVWVDRPLFILRVVKLLINPQVKDELSQSTAASHNQFVKMQQVCAPYFEFKNYGNLT